MIKITTDDHKKADLYLEWLNDFLTTESFAAYLGVPVEQARDIIIYGRAMHSLRVRSATEYSEVKK